MILPVGYDLVTDNLKTSLRLEIMSMQGAQGECPLRYGGMECLCRSSVAGSDWIRKSALGSGIQVCVLVCAPAVGLVLDLPCRGGMGAHL
jgi:hypothetical protein